MEKFADVLQVVLPVIVMIALGILARKKHILSQAGIEDVKSLIVNICLPAVIFNTFYATEFTGTAILLCVIMAVFTLGAWFIGSSAQRLLHVKQPLMPYLCTTIEGGMVGYALFILLFGQDNLYHLALFDLGNTIIVFPVLLTCLRMRTQGTVRVRETVRTLITPINIAIVSGLLVNACGLGSIISTSPVGAVMESVLSFVSGPTGALILLVVGFGMDFSDIRWSETLRTIAARVVIFGICGSVLSFVSGPTGALILLVVGFGMDFSDIRWSETLRTIAARVVIFGICGVLVYRLVCTLLPADPLYGFAVIMTFILPPSFVFSAYTQGRQEESYVGSVLAVYTLLTLIGYSLLAWIAA